MCKVCNWTLKLPQLGIYKSFKYYDLMWYTGEMQHRLLYFQKTGWLLVRPTETLRFATHFHTLNMWEECSFQQDVACLLYFNWVTVNLNTKCSYNWIRRGMSVACPAYFPGLTLFEFFFWEQVKSKIFSLPTHLNEKLKK